jgi:glycosyltransferase involved in cell wall biosynthesis
MDISVIIPTYRPADYLWQCLDSICAQTLPYERFEVVIVLNGCKEPYYKKISAYLADKPLHAVLIQTDEPGVSHARNLGLDNARGEYVVFLDDDDWLSPNYLENLLMSASPGKIVEANVMVYWEEYGCFSPYHFLAQAYGAYTPPKWKSIIFIRCFLSSACCKLIPMAMIGSVRFDPCLRFGEDAFFMASISRNLEDFGLASADTFYYIRIRQDSASHQQQSYKERAGVVFRLCGNYVRLYLSDMRHYNFLFIASRIVATLRRLFRRSWEV